MATKTFEELKQLAIQIRDEKTNKQNTATRVGTAMLEHINKLEQDYYDKTQTDEELKERDDKLTELYTNTITVNSESTTRFFNLIHFRGKKIAIRVDGVFGFIGYYKTDDSYEKISVTRNEWIIFHVPNDATDLYVYNDTVVGKTTVNTCINPYIEMLLSVGYLELCAQKINNNGNFKLDITAYRGAKIKVKVDGTFTQCGYFTSDSSYKVVSKTPNTWVDVDVPEDAVSFFVNNGTGEEQTVNVSLRANLAKDVEDLKCKIEKLSTSLGYCYGGSLNINTTNHTFTTSFKYAGIGINGYKSMNNVTDKSVVPTKEGTYSGFWVAFLNWDTVEIDVYMFNSIPSDLSNMYIIAMGHQFGSDCVSFSTSNISPSVGGITEKLKNLESTLESTKEDLGVIPKITYTVNSNGSTRYLNIEKYIGEKISVKVTGTFTQFGYYMSGSSYTILSKIPDVWCTFEVPQDATDLFVYNNESIGTTNPIMEVRTNIASEILENANNIEKNTESIKELSESIGFDVKGCVFMSLGDSITTESYYIPKLRQILQPSKYYNLAVASATWADRSNTTSYDGDPQFQGDQSQNVLGNQVQKIINNPETYNVAPDIIVISASTNDGTPISVDKTDYEMRVEIDSHFNENSTTPIEVTEPTFDDSDTYMSHRKTIAGAMRYCVLKLQSMYPNARIYILTPIQGSYNPNKDYVTAQEVKQRYLTEVAKHLAVPVIHVGEECGINRDFEYGGTYWNEEWATSEHPKNGRDLIDGLHPNESGSWKIAKYVARRIINDFVE